MGEERACEAVALGNQEPDTDIEELHRQQRQGVRTCCCLMKSTILSRGGFNIKSDRVPKPLGSRKYVLPSPFSSK